jgi:hypothetical protein
MKRGIKMEEGILLTKTIEAKEERPLSKSIFQEIATSKVTDVYEEGFLRTKHYKPEEVLEVVEKFTSDKKRSKVYFRNPFAPQCVQKRETYYTTAVKETDSGKRIHIDKKIKVREVPLISKGLFREVTDDKKETTRDIQVKRLTIEIRK